MRIAIASSGLGFVRRGIESWAVHLAEKLHERGDVEVVLFHGGANVSCPNVTLSYLNRGRPSNLFLSSIAPSFTWRWGWKSTYGIEQFTFARSLIKELRRNPVDIVHTQDVIVAQMLEAARKKGRITAKTILAHGTEESMECLAQFEYLQELSPPYAARHGEHAVCAIQDAGCGIQDEKRESGQHLPKETQNGGASSLSVGRKVFMIPNFVATDVFTIAENAGQINKIRQDLSVPEDAFVIGCVAALQSTRKRLDSLIHEVADLEGGEQFLLLAGASTGETKAVEMLAEDLLPGRHLILSDLPREQLPNVYRCMDLYVHPAPEEIFGICLLESMASGVPVVAHNSEVLKWVVGGAGGACETEDRRLKTEDRGQKTEVHSSRAKLATWRSGGQRTEDGAQPTTGLLEGRGGWCVDVTKKGALAEVMGSAGGACETEVGGQRSEVGRQRIEDRPKIQDAGYRMQDEDSKKDLATEQPLSLRDKGADARRHVEEKFSVEAVIPQMISMYHRVLEDGREKG